jgi:hypothetical protein
MLAEEFGAVSHVENSYVRKKTFLVVEEIVRTVKIVFNFGWYINDVTHF